MVRFMDLPLQGNMVLLLEAQPAFASRAAWALFTLLLSLMLHIVHQ